MQGHSWHKVHCSVPVQAQICAAWWHTGGPNVSVNNEDLAKHRHHVPASSSRHAPYLKLWCQQAI